MKLAAKKPSPDTRQWVLDKGKPVPFEQSSWANRPGSVKPEDAIPLTEKRKPVALKQHAAGLAAQTAGYAIGRTMADLIGEGLASRGIKAPPKVREALPHVLEEIDILHKQFLQDAAEARLHSIIEADKGAPPWKPGYKLPAQQSFGAQAKAHIHGALSRLAAKAFVPEKLMGLLSALKPDKP